MSETHRIKEGTVTICEHCDKPIFIVQVAGNHGWYDNLKEHHSCERSETLKVSDMSGKTRTVEVPESPYPKPQPLQKVGKGRKALDNWILKWACRRAQGTA